MATSSSSSPAGNQTTLRRLAGKCLDLFDQCLSLPTLSRNEFAWFEGYRARFRWWSFGLKVQSQGRASLDRRLAHREDVRDAIAAVLKGLAEALEDCLAESRSQGAANDAEEYHSDVSSPVSLVESVLFLGDCSDEAEGSDGPLRGISARHTRFIEMALESLLRFSIFIRKSGDKLKHKRADEDLGHVQTHAPETYAEFKAHLETLILISPYEHSLLTRLDSATAGCELPQTVGIVIRAWLQSRLGPIQHRLVQANIVRRHRVMCSRREGRQGSSALAPPKPATKAKPPTGVPSTSARPPEFLPTAGPVRPPTISTAPGADARFTSNTSALSSGTAAGSDFRTTAVRSGRATSVVSKLTCTGQNQDYPKPSALERSPLCPYCGFVLDLEYARNEKKWHGHIAYDLSPYTCLFPDCSSPYNLYTTKAQWLKHMSAAHSVTQWRCTECPLNLDDDVDKTLFRTESEFERHMLEHHAASFDPVDLPLWLEISERSIIEPVSCPVCLNDRNLVRVEQDEHIATHMHSFSLRALPWDFDLDEDVASAGSSDSPPGPGQPPVMDDDDNPPEEPQIDVLTLTDAVKDLSTAILQFAMSPEQPDPSKRVNWSMPLDAAQLTGLLQRLHVWAAFRQSTPSQKQLCASLLWRIQESLRRLTVGEVEDSAQISDLGSSITLDLQALEECISQQARQDHDIWQEAFRALPADTQKRVQALIDADATNAAPLPEQLDKLLKLAWELEERASDDTEHAIAHEIAASVQLLADDESIFLSPQTNLPWAVLLVAMKLAISLFKKDTFLALGPARVGLTRSNTLWALRFALRAINRGRLYCFAYTLENTPEKALAAIRFALLTLYSALLELLVTTSVINPEVKERATARAIANPKTASGLIGKLYVLADKLESEARTCQESSVGYVEADILRSLENIPRIHDPDYAQGNDGPGIGGDEQSDGEEDDQYWDLTDLRWVSPLSFDQIHTTIQHQKAPGTCEWLLDREEFRNWENSQVSSIFYLRGSPGTGKTFLAAAAVDHLRERTAASPTSEGLAFVYCGGMDAANRHSSSPMLLNLLRQLLPLGDRRIVRIIKKLARTWDEAGSNDPDLAKGMIAELLSEALLLYAVTTVVLDGLDHLAPSALIGLVDTLGTMLECSPRLLRLFLTSRDGRGVSHLSKCSALWYQTTLPRWQADSNLESETALPHTFFDVQRVVTQEWSEIPPDVRDAVVRNSEGMFLYAVLQTRMLRDVSGTQDITTSTVEDLPIPVEILEIYQKADNRIRGLHHESKTLLRRALVLMLSAKSGALTSDELLSALRIDPTTEAFQLRDISEEWLQDIWPEILVLDWDAELGSVWRFTHSACATFFKPLEPEGHLDAARIYLKLLLSSHPDSSPPAPSLRVGDPIFDPAHPLQVSARHHWVLHALAHQEDSSDLPDPVLCRLLKRFLGSPSNSSPAYQQWFKAVASDMHPPASTVFPRSVLESIAPETQSVFAVCQFALFDLLKDWWTDPSMELSVRNKKGQTLLEIVDINRPDSFATGRRLVELGFDVNMPQAGPGRTTALASAVSMGDVEWVRFLIDHGASVHPDPGSALAMAAEMDRPDLVQMLIDAGALVDADEDARGYGSVLAAAAASAGPQTIRALLDAGANVNKGLSSGRFGSCLAAAAGVGDVSCLRVLLDAGADVNQELHVGDYGSALAAAACQGRMDSLLALLDAGADVNRLLSAGDYGSALAAAASNGREECVRALLEAGADVNLAIPKLGSALAASIPHRRCMYLVIDAGADVNRLLPPGNHLFPQGDVPGKGGSALAIAVEAGRLDCVDLLISAGADVNLLHVSEELKCGSSLVAAAFVGSAPCLSRLIKAGADVDQQTLVGVYGTALIAAAGQGHLECVRFLMAAGADVNKVVEGHPGLCQTALIAAAYLGRQDCVKFLIENGATVSLKVNARLENALLAALADVSDEELERCERHRDPGPLAGLWFSRSPQSLSAGKAGVARLLKKYGVQE